MKAASKNEAALIARAQASDPVAFDALAAPHYAAICRALGKYLPNPADREECAQEALTSAWLAIRKFEGRSSFKTWFYKIAMNQAKAMLRAADCRPKTVDLTDEAGELVDIAEVIADKAAPSPEAIAEGAELAAGLAEAMSELSPNLRNVVELFADGRSHREIAKRLEISPGACKVRLHEARAKVKESLESRGLLALAA